MLSAYLSHLALGCRDLSAADRFYREIVGLSPHERGRGWLRLGWGRGDHVLELREGLPGLDHFGLEVREPRQLDELAARLERAGVRTTGERPPGAHPPTLTFADPEGHRVEVHGRVDRSGEVVADGGRRPIRLHHLTLVTTAIVDLEDFYCRVVGFRVSDRMGEIFTWLRCNPEHHTLAAVVGDAPGLDHHAYEVAGWADFKTWGDELAARNVPLIWGPGRHGPGNNLFVMFDDPEGNHVELSAEMERFYDDRAEYRPRTWAVGPRTVNLWGPVADLRRMGPGG
ncbi:MAG TPA: VOC family protein [Candidatus Dormibacteraeota bacterium]|nr:VOC family protein [Candidatus Dormibacteraeota bacterium]